MFEAAETAWAETEGFLCKWPITGVIMYFQFQLGVDGLRQTISVQKVDVNILSLVLQMQILLCCVCHDPLVL